MDYWMLAVSDYIEEIGNDLRVVNYKSTCKYKHMDIFVASMLNSKSISKNKNEWPIINS